MVIAGRPVAILSPVASLTFASRQFWKAGSAGGVGKAGSAGTLLLRMVRGR